eukprot:Amastigsp_a841804_114.p1 type:complete len:395 gc:universal Amastigsp_a841804_114:1-1185(+)
MGTDLSLFLAMVRAGTLWLMAALLAGLVQSQQMQFPSSFKFALQFVSKWQAYEFETSQSAARSALLQRFTPANATTPWWHVLTNYSDGTSYTWRDDLGCTRNPDVPRGFVSILDCWNRAAVPAGACGDSGDDTLLALEPVAGVEIALCATSAASPLTESVASNNQSWSLSTFDSFKAREPPASDFVLPARCHYAEPKVSVRDDSSLNVSATFRYSMTLENEAPAGSFKTLWEAWSSELRGITRLRSKTTSAGFTNSIARALGTAGWSVASDADDWVNLLTNYTTGTRWVWLETAKTCKRLPALEPGFVAPFGMWNALARPVGLCLIRSVRGYLYEYVPISGASFTACVDENSVMLTVRFTSGVSDVTNAYADFDSFEPDEPSAKDLELPTYCVQ